MTTFDQTHIDPANLHYVGGHSTYLSTHYGATSQEPSLDGNIPFSSPQTYGQNQAASPERVTSTSFNYHSQMDIDLLSSETYNQAYDEPTRSLESPHLSNQAYGGLLTKEQEPSLPRTRTRARKGSKKELAKSANPDETTRHRGRPRLDTNDQTAAERRRTQIRLAQRAYRQRKETTISGLNKRVSSLEQTILDMHRNFLDFKDEATAGGLRAWNPALAGSLDRSVEVLAELAKNGAHESDGGEEEPEEVTPPSNVLSSRDWKPQLVKRESDPGQRRRQPGADAGLGTSTIWGYSPTFEHSIDGLDRPNQQQDVTDEIDHAAMQHWEEPNAEIAPTDQDLQLYQLSIPEPSFHPVLPGHLGVQPIVPQNSFSISKSLPLPKTFTNTETSFARRLVRSSLESAISLLSSPTTSPDRIRHFCKFTFCYSNRSRILSCLKQMVARTSNDNLEFWHVPFYHHGGSGLHYPRVGIDASSRPPENWAMSGPMGPAFEYTPETTEFNGVQQMQIYEELGIDGEWFDSNDVDQYLRTKGVYLDGQSSIVEITDTNETCIPEMTTPGNSVSSPSNTMSSTYEGPQSPRTDFIPTNAIVYGNEELLNGSALGYDDVVPDVDMDTIFQQLGTTTTGPSESLTSAQKAATDFNFNISPSMTQMQERSQTRTHTQDQDSYFSLKRKKYVDVDKFLETIVPQSVCLGRTPGFRRANVDDALKVATTEGLGEM